MRLTSLDFVVEALVRVEWHPDGWRVWIRHRHHAGGFTDCTPAEYEKLTHTELLEVLEVTLWEYGPISAQRGQ